MSGSKEGNGIDFIFHANTESGKTDDLTANPKVNLAFLNSSGEWASISGHATVNTDRDYVHKHYSPALKAWIGDLGDGTHDGGPDDPRICVITVQAQSAQYAVSDKTAIGGLVELAKGVATGEAPSVHKLRRIEEPELVSCKEFRLSVCRSKLTQKYQSVPGRHLRKTFTGCVPATDSTLNT